MAAIRNSFLCAVLAELCIRNYQSHTLQHLQALCKRAKRIDGNNMTDNYRSGEHATSDGRGVVPSDNDVLFGRGTKHHLHPGNARFNGRHLCIAQLSS
jgi:hypothetical protein